MSVSLMHKALKVPNVKPAERYFLVVMADMAEGSSGQFSKSYSELAARFGVSRQTAMRVVKRLIKLGYLERCQIQSPEGEYRPNTYFLKLDYQ